MVIKTSGSFVISENNDPIPSDPNAAPKVVGSWESACVKPVEEPKEVKPIWIPNKALATMLIKIAPFTLRTSNTIVKTRPISASQTVGVFSVTIAGTELEFAITVPLSKLVICSRIESELKQSCVFDANIGNRYADSSANCMLQTDRNRINN